MATITTEAGQTPLDLAVQLYGDATRAVSLCVANSLPSLTDTVSAGTTITYDLLPTTDPAYAYQQFMLDRGLSVNTSQWQAAAGGSFSPGFSTGFGPISNPS